MSLDAEQGEGAEGPGWTDEDRAIAARLRARREGRVEGRATPAALEAARHAREMRRAPVRPGPRPRMLPVFGDRPDCALEVACITELDRAYPKARAASCPAGCEAFQRLDTRAERDVFASSRPGNG